MCWLKRKRHKYVCLEYKGRMHQSPGVLYISTITHSFLTRHLLLLIPSPSSLLSFIHNMFICIYYWQMQSSNEMAQDEEEYYDANYSDTCYHVGMRKMSYKMGMPPQSLGQSTKSATSSLSVHPPLKSEAGSKQEMVSWETKR